MRRPWTTAVLAGLLVTGWAGAAPAQASSLSVPSTCNGLPVTIPGTDGDDTVTGTDNSDVIATGDGADVVLGLGAQDTVCLGPGNDRFVGGPGVDSFIADSTTDGRDVVESTEIVSYAARVLPVVVTVDGVANDGQAGEGDDVGNSLTVVDGGSGADVLTAPLTTPGTGLHGGPGNDRLTAGQFLFGEAGDDVLTHQGPLRATMDGGDGGDRLVDNGTGGSSMDGGPGDDVLTAGGGGPGAFMTGRDGNDKLTGGPDRDVLLGDGGNDLLVGGAGNDQAEGGAGDDRYLAGVSLDGSDTFTGGDGRDTADYQNRDNLSRGTVVSISAAGAAGNDGEPGEGDTMTAENIRGGTGRNVVVGDPGANRLEGGRSNDVIDSRDGIGRNDVVVGNGGTDDCRFDAGPPPDDVRC
jgi:Ca2+-binding RTX toxin-like protein